MVSMLLVPRSMILVTAPVRRRPRDRRAQILAAVLPVVLERGMAVTSKELADAAGVDRGAVHLVWQTIAGFSTAFGVDDDGSHDLGIDAQRRETWLKGRAHVKKKIVAENFEDMRECVLQGEITRDQIMLTDELFDIYSRHQREIDDALSAYGQRRAYRAAAKLRAGEFSTHVVFVHGDAGIGKTRFATDFITEAISAANAHGERWQVYRAATGNPLDDWRGEEVLLLDDLRASAMDANDWLLLLDPYNASPAKARYKNKGEVAPRLIVITATIEPVEFFYYARQKGNVDEALDQFIRRLASVVKVYRADDINRYLVQHIGKIEPFEWHQCSVPTAAHTPGMYGNAYHRNAGSRELTYGPETSAEHDAEGAVAELLGGLAVRSPDVPLALIGGAA